MDTRTIIYNSLLRADLPFDEEHTNLALGYLNGNIERFWYKDKADFRLGENTIATVVGQVDYAIDKDCDEIIKYSFRGPNDNTRSLSYLAPLEFHRKVRDLQGETGTPYIWTDGKTVGYDTQITTTDQLEAYSTLTTKTAGTVSVTAGNNRIIGSGTSFTKNDEGSRFKKDGDADSYVIARVIDSTTIDLETKYRGFSTSGSSYKVGDVGVLVNIEGVSGGEITRETIELDGDTVVASLKTYSSLIGVSKDSLTGGAVVVREQDSDIVLATMAQGEYEVERKLVELFPIPSAVETLSYKFYAHHPELKQETDRIRVPKKYHDGLLAMLEADLMGWNGSSIPERVADRIARAWAERDNDVNSTLQENVVMDSDDSLFLGNYYNRDTDFGYND